MSGPTRRPILATLVLGLALPFAAIFIPTTAPTASAAVEPCYTAQSGGAGDDYDGPSASYRYDRIFPAASGCSTGSPTPSRASRPGVTGGAARPTSSW